MVRQRAVAAGVWSGIDIGLRFGVQFVVAIVLARFLSPTEFGIYALTAIFVGLSGVVLDGGLSTALIQSRETSREVETAAFCYNVVAALLLAAATAAAASLMARLYGYPVLEPLLYCSAVLIVLNGLGAVPTAMLTRAMRFNLVARAGVASSVLSGAVGIGAAVYGAGIWAFPAQALTAAIVNIALLWILGGWRPVRRFRMGDALHLGRFGSFVALASIFDVAYTHGSALIIGKLHGATDLGYYNRAQNLQLIPSGALSAVIARVALPVLAGVADDAGRLRTGVRLAIGSAMLVNLPLMAGLAILSDLVITVLFGARWLPAAPVLTILAVGGMLYPIHLINVQLLLAQGRSDRFFKLELAKKSFGILCVAVGSIFGILGLAVSQLAFAVVAFFINAYFTRLTLSYGPFAQLRDLAGPTLLTAAMACLLMVARPLLHFGDFINLAILFTGGGVFFVAFTFMLRVGVSDELLSLTPLAKWMKRRTTGERSE